MLHLLCPLRYVIALVLSLQLVNPAAAAGPEWLYAVNPGDTLISVAVNYLANPNDWRQLQKLNDVTEPRRLMPGTKLRLPVALLKREAVIAEVIHVHGKVTHTSKNDHPQNLIAGARLEVGDIIETSANASVSMRFVDGSRLLLIQNTQVTLAEMILFGKTGMAKTVIDLKRKIPESPQLVPPQIDDKQLLFHWRSGKAGEKFQVQVARNPDFTQPIMDNVVSISQSQIDSPQPGTYYLRVKTIDADGFAGPFGPCRKWKYQPKPTGGYCFCCSCHSLCKLGSYHVHLGCKICPYLVDSADGLDTNVGAKFYPAVSAARCVVFG
jgi:LysM repeat protein